MTRFLLICLLALFPFAEVALGESGTSVGVTMTAEDEDNPSEITGSDDTSYEDDVAAENPNINENAADDTITDSANSGSSLLREKDVETVARSAKERNPAWATHQERSVIDDTRAVLTPTHEGLREKAKIAAHLKSRRRHD